MVIKQRCTINTTSLNFKTCTWVTVLFLLHDGCRIFIYLLRIVVKALISVLSLIVWVIFFIFLFFFGFDFAQQEKKKVRLTLNYFIIAFEESEGRAGLIMAKSQVCKLVVR